VETILEVTLTNTALAALFGLLVVSLGRWFRRPGALHLLWLLVLVKLVTPPVWRLPILPARVVATHEQMREEISAPAGSPASLPESAGAVAPSEARPGSAGDSTEALSPGTEPGGDTEPQAALGTPPHPIDQVPATSDAVNNRDRHPKAISFAWPGVAISACVLWLAGSLAWVGLAIRRVIRFRRVLKMAEPAPRPLVDRVEALATELGLRAVPQVLLVAGRVSPCVWALARRPVLVLPSELWSRLDAEQQGALLLHELAHLRRRDPLVRVVELAATAAHWWNPVLWWARRGLHEAEELCCDAWVVRARPGAAPAYATALVETLDFLSGPQAVLSSRTVPFGASGLGRLHHVSRRITMIMKARPNPAPGIFGGLVAVALGALLLPLWPTWAQPQSVVEPAATPPTGIGSLARPTPVQDPNALAVDPSPATDDAIETALTAVQLQQARLKKSEALYRGSMAPLARMKRANSISPNAHSPEELAKAQADVESAEADVDIAKVELRQAELKLTHLQRSRTTTPAPAGGEAPRPVSRAPQPRQAQEPTARRSLPDLPPQRPSAGSDRERIRAVNSLKQLLLAMHNYHDREGHFPPVATRTRDGKLGVSWRVLLLPYLEQEPLYKQFHLDESWDSAHNRPLIEQMPELYRSYDAANGDTRFRAVAGIGTIWDKAEGVRVADITDGTSNTIALIESKHVVPWTAPDESPSGREEGSTHPEIQQILKEGVIAGMADGSVHVMRVPTFQDWLALTSRAGGEVIDFNKFDPAAREPLPAARVAQPTPTRRPAEPTERPGAPRDRFRAINNLKQVVLAMHNYAATHDDRFPPIATGAGGRMNLSWRVLILPYLDEGALFQQFKLDEPWDSPNNKPLIERMPQVFQTPGDPAGTTRYKGMMGLGGPGRETLWGYPEGVKITEIVDGTSNTIAVVEGLKPILWTKPEDLELEQDSPEREHLFAQGFLAAMADGSVRAFANDGPDSPLLLKALFTRSGGEVIDWERFGPMINTRQPDPNRGGLLGDLFGGKAAAERERRRAEMAAAEARAALQQREAAEAQQVQAAYITKQLQNQIDQLRAENAALRKQLEDSRKNLERR
jgi:beta-lactamase regulating signal transducer with metallopeptidase domain